MPFAEKLTVSRRDSNGKVRKGACDSSESNFNASSKSPVYKLKRLKSLCAERIPRPAVIMKSECTVMWSITLLVALVFFVHFVASITHGHLMSDARIEKNRISYFIGKSWRRLVGISSSNYTYPGRLPPYIDPGSSICSRVPSYSVETPSGSPSVNKSDGPEFDFCVAISVGDDGAQPHDRALPYQLVYTRLFEALKEEIHFLKAKRSTLRKTDEVQVLVGVDFESVVCRMVRDYVEELPAGVQAQCTKFEDLELRTKCGRLVTGRTTRFVPQISELFRDAVKWTSARWVDLDCLDLALETPLLAEKDWQPTVVTGFSSNHMEVGLLLLRSLGRAAKEGLQTGKLTSKVSVVVWAMDVFKLEHQKLLDCVIDEMINEYNVRVEVRKFDFAAHPKWMHINQELGYFGGTGEYAWKAVMVHTVLIERGIAIWADAGDRFIDSDSLAETIKTLRLTGFVSRKSHGTVVTRTHPSHLKFFRADLPGIWDQECCEAAIVAFTLKKYREIARPWYECSVIRQCIAPDGSDRSNHRQDQAALTVLSILSRNTCEGGHPNFRHHMDDNPLTVFAGAYTTHCYVDPLELSRDLPQGTFRDPHVVHEGPYLTH